MNAKLCGGFSSRLSAFGTTFGHQRASSADPLFCGSSESCNSPSSVSKSVALSGGVPSFLAPLSCTDEEAEKTAPLSPLRNNVVVSTDTVGHTKVASSSCFSSFPAGLPDDCRRGGKQLKSSDVESSGGSSFNGSSSTATSFVPPLLLRCRRVAYRPPDLPRKPTTCQPRPPPTLWYQRSTAVNQKQAPLAGLCPAEQDQHRLASDVSHSHTSQSQQPHRRLQSKQEGRGDTCELSDAVAIQQDTEAGDLEDLLLQEAADQVKALQYLCIASVAHTIQSPPLAALLMRRVRSLSSGAGIQLGHRVQQLACFNCHTPLLPSFNSVPRLRTFTCRRIKKKLNAAYQSQSRSSKTARIKSQLVIQCAICGNRNVHAGPIRSTTAETSPSFTQHSETPQMGTEETLLRMVGVSSLQKRKRKKTEASWAAVGPRPSYSKRRKAGALGSVEEPPEGERRSSTLCGFKPRLTATEPPERLKDFRRENAPRRSVGSETRGRRETNSELWMTSADRSLFAFAPDESLEKKRRCHGLSLRKPSASLTQPTASKSVENEHNIATENNTLMGETNRSATFRDLKALENLSREGKRKARAVKEQASASTK